MDAEQCLREASIPILLMCLAQITGEAAWLREPYRPKRDRRLFHDESGGLPEPVQAEVRAAMAAVLADLSAGRRKVPEACEPQHLHEMMRVCVDDDVPDEYVPMLMEDLGWRSRDVQWRNDEARRAAADRRVLVIGAGMSGVCIAVHLLRLGFDVTVVERQAGVGGVWMENRYPDAGVDTPNQFYSYSFAPSTGWSSYFSKRDEVLAYFRTVAREHAVEQVTRFETAVERVQWIAARRKWEAVLRSAGGEAERHEFDAVISAVGQMNQPREPDVPGRDRFEGAVFHSARWRDDVELSGARVVVVGAGASAMQLVPPVARQAAHLTLLQRSPQWVLPVPDYHRKVSAATRWLLDEVPFYQAWYRFGLFWRFSDGILKTLRRDPRWPHPERAVNAANDRVRQMMTDYMKAQLAGREDLVDKLLPDYPPYGKRILIDNHWFETMRRPNVEVVSAGLGRFMRGGVVDDRGGVHLADAVVLATGFQAGRMLHTVEVIGRDGERLAERWGDDDPRAFLGIAVPGCPNFFCLYGPNSNLGHGGSAIFQVECQARYVTACLVHMVEQGLATLEVRAEVHDAYNAQVDREHAGLVWSHPGMTNWYRNARGRVFSIMPWRMVDFWQMTHDPDFDDHWLAEA